MQNLSRTLIQSVSVAALFAVAASGNAVAQTTPTGDGTAAAVEEVVVTGTSIRGVAPVGSNLVTVDRATIEDTGSINVTQMLKTVPSITNFSGSGVGQLPGISYYSPTIHSLGSSGSNSTLVLVDGHRLPEGGNQHVLPDPNIIPALAVQRVEVLADGSSSVYGSDAVAGVVNFITRKRYDGFEANVQTGYGDGYGTMSGGALFGKTWDSGWAMAAYGYSRSSNYRPDYDERPFSAPDKTSLAIANGLLPPGSSPTSLTNYSTFTCDPATIQMAGDSTIYPSAAAKSSVANQPQNSPCPYGPNAPGSYNGTGAETRNTVMMKIGQDIGDRISVDATFDYGYRDTAMQQSSGTLQATVFGTGPQANPFYQTPAGYTGAATSETIRWDPTDLIGYGLNDNHSEDWFGNLNEEYRITDDIRLTGSQVFANDESYVITRGILNSSAATLALNGTTNTAGSTTTPSIAGTNYVILNTPLTAANALDVWDPASTNKTSTAVLQKLKDYQSSYHGTYMMKDMRFGIDGKAFTLPGGPLRFAAGVEYLSVIQDSENDFPGNFGASGQGSTIAYYPLSRTTYSYYGELDIPIVGPDMNVPFVRSLNLDVSGRYDDYSDVGNTANPKLALEWEAIDGLKFRANMSTSFVAPSQRSVGNPALDGLNSLSRATPNTTSAQIPTAVFPNIIGDPGCAAGATLCQINSTVQGVYRYTGNPNTKPEKGRAWNLGVDYAPDFVPGLSFNLTLFNNKLLGGVTSPPINSIINNTSLNSRLKFCNPGAPCTQQQITDFLGNVPVTQALPSSVYYLYDQTQTNIFNLYLEGLDAAVNYSYQTDDWGTFGTSLALTQFLQFDQNYNGSPRFSLLNTSGYATQFASIATQGRVNFNWSFEGFSTSIYVNFLGGYRNWSSSTISPVLTHLVDGQNVPYAGGDQVKPTETVDLHVSYDLMHMGLTQLGDSQAYVDIRNLFDTNPPYFNSSTGYDPFSGNPLGRVVSVGLRVKY